jgi:aldose sugar dehydrogenase
MKRSIALAIAFAAVALGSGSSPAGARPHAAPAAIGAVPVVTGLAWPAGFTFAPDGRIFYGERFTGKIRIYDPSTGSNTLFFTITNISTQGEQGLLGIALHPQFETTRPYVFAYATRSTPSGLRNQIVRIKDVSGTGTSPKVIFSSDTVAGTYHDGGRIMFGPDGNLFAVVGEGHDSSNSQDLTNNAGKILRMNGNGQAPPDNPHPPSLIWSYGHRNSFGFTFDPLTGNMWETENGPECNDEINLIARGANFGWGPSETCSQPPPPPKNTNQDGPNPVLPLAWFTPTIAPVGTEFCEACGLGSASEGTMFFGMNNSPHEIRRVALTPDRKGIQSITTVYTHTEGLVSMEVGVDHALYFSDSNAIYKLVQT